MWIIGKPSADEPRNIMATTYAVAEKGADLIKADIK